jgi:hypothetical protein
MRLRGRTKRGDNPSLRVEVAPKSGDANIDSASVALPSSIFLAQDHLDTICTRVQFSREDCPSGSRYGHARVFTPLLEKPLEGDVYLRSSDKLPDLVIALRGGGAATIAIDLVGRIDSYKSGLRGTFNDLPDAPVSRFILNLRGGKHGLLVNAADLCASRRAAIARFVGQANRGLAWRPAIKSRCGSKPGTSHKANGERKERGR